jgi:hypothetical protein
MENIYRQPTNDEFELLNRMLEVDFQGAKELKHQLAGLLVKSLDKGIDNYDSIELKVSSGRSVKVEKRVPVVARAYDSDGTPIEVLLHVLNGQLNELEVIKFDGTPIVDRPKASEYIISLE